jgi:hypothetical protein
LAAAAAGFSAAAGSAFLSGFGDGFRAFAGPDLVLLPPGTSTGLASTSGVAMFRDRTLGAPAMEAMSARQHPELLPPKNSKFTGFPTRAPQQPSRRGNKKQITQRKSASS